jgi:hypothetical protein
MVELGSEWDAQLAHVLNPILLQFLIAGSLNNDRRV